MYKIWPVDTVALEYTCLVAKRAPAGPDCKSGTHSLPYHALTRLHADFNLEFYTEVQDLAHLARALSSASPRYAAQNMAIEDFGLVGFETLAVEVRILAQVLDSGH